MTSVQTSAVPLVSPDLDEDTSRKRPLEEEALAIQPQKQPKLSDHLYKGLVSNAFDSAEKGDRSPMDQLASQIDLPLSNPEAISPPSFAVVLKTLCQEMSRVDNKLTARASTDLIRAILRYDWLAQKNEPQFMKAYATFLTVLVSALPKWFSEVANKLVADFTRFPDTELPLHHNTLKYLLHAVPASINSLPSILRGFCPNKAASKEILVNYTGNMLTIVSYSDYLRDSVWSLIIEKLITLDVELQNEIDDVDEDDIDDALQGSEDESSDSDSGSDSDSDSDSDEELPSTNAVATNTVATAATTVDDADDTLFDEEEYNVEIHTITDLSAKLDAIMDLIFERTKNSFTAESLEGGNGLRLFNTLKSIFKTYVLPTHYTRCVQYLLFHMVQQQSELTDSFLVMLIEVVFDPNQMTANRIKAMQYVSSFIARAKSLNREQMLAVLKYLLAWCDEYVTERENEVGDGKGGMERFKILYSVLQGLMYIFCFRYKELKNEYNDSEWELKLDKFFNKVIMSKFNPLKYCNETVVLIFARISQSVDLCYCFSIIEKNKRERLNGVRNPAAAGVVATDSKFESKQEFLDLEAYFPFDPLMLKKSKQVVECNYIEWQSVDESDDSDE